MIRLSTPLGIAAALAGAIVLASPTDASACGGSFSRPPPDPQNPETIQIAAQRMVLSISEAQTVLWSQIEYEGPPEEFAWVLPVGPGSTIELANPLWFDALEAVSSKHVAPPGVCGPAPIYEESSSGGCSPGCGAGSANPGGDRGLPQEEEGKSSVDVVSRGTLGPYETVTLSSKDGQAVMMSWHCEDAALNYSVLPQVREEWHAIVARYRERYDIFDDWGMFAYTSGPHKPWADYLVEIDVGIWEQRLDDETWSAWVNCKREISEVSLKYGGSITACHGATRAGDAELVPTEMGSAWPVVKRIKRALDPNNIMNPGKQSLDEAYEEDEL